MYYYVYTVQKKDSQRRSWQIALPRLDAASQWRAVLMPWVAQETTAMADDEGCFPGKAVGMHLIIINWNLTSTLEFTGKFTRRVSLNAHRISEVWKIMEVSDIGMLWLRCAFTAVAVVSFISYFPGALLLGIDLNSLDVDSLLGPLARSQGKWNRKKWSRQTHKSQS